MENKYQNQSMTFQSILTILEEQMKAEALRRKVNVHIHIQGVRIFIQKGTFKLCLCLETL